eukprot:2447365-Alexandrium_andersonii.AAC.1
MPSSKTSSDSQCSKLSTISCMSRLARKSSVCCTTWPARPAPFRQRRKRAVSCPASLAAVDFGLEGTFPDAPATELGALRSLLGEDAGTEGAAA